MYLVLNMSATLSTSMSVTNYPIPKIYYVEVWGDGVHCWMGKAPGQKENGEEVDDWVAAGTDGQQSPFYHRRLFSGPRRIRREDSLGIIIRLDTHRQQHLRCLYCHLSPDRQCIMYCSANVLQRDCICRIVHEHTCRIITWLYLGVVRLYLVRFPDLLW